jgi:hypothetical protein
MQVTTEEIIYPCSDGQPMADSTIQYKLIVMELRSITFTIQPQTI